MVGRGWGEEAVGYGEEVAGEVEGADGGEAGNVESGFYDRTIRYFSWSHAHHPTCPFMNNKQRFTKKKKKGKKPNLSIHFKKNRIIADFFS